MGSPCSASHNGGRRVLNSITCHYVKIRPLVISMPLLTDMEVYTHVCTIATAYRGSCSSGRMRTESKPNQKSVEKGWARCAEPVGTRISFIRTEFVAYRKRHPVDRAKFSRSESS